MKLVFVRHGEAMDDIQDRYGGWYDPDLSPKGISEASEVGRALVSKKIQAQIILSSPLSRAFQAAVEISKILNLPVRVFIYLKERNTYGLLSGENKESARNDYPELVSKFEDGGLVDGAENYDEFVLRIRKMLNKIIRFKYGTVLCVTHGKLLTALLTDIVKKKVEKLDQNCIVILNLTKAGKIEYLSSDGVIFA